MFWKKRNEMSESRYDLLQKEDESGETSFSSSSIDTSLRSGQIGVNMPSSHTISKELAFSITGLLGTIIVIMVFLLRKQTTWHPKTPVPDCKPLVHAHFASTC
jgi:hypothetical protein